MTAMALPLPAAAQQKLSDVRVVVREARQERDSIRAVLDIEIDGASVAATESMYLFPVIRYGANESRMLPLVITGRRQQAVVNRTEKLSGQSEAVYARYTAGRNKPLRENITYSAAVPVEEWMRDANVVMEQQRRDCRGAFHRFSVEVIAEGIRLIEKPARADYLLPIKMPVPPREQIKTRSAYGEAQIIYRVGNADINPDMGNNGAELGKIRRSIEEIRGVEGVTIDTVSIASYASPEGTWQSNLALSQRRAASLVGWIRRNYDLHGVTLASNGLGEDWNGLAELVKDDLTMTMSEKQYVLQTISDTDINDGRESLLMRYNQGRTYRYMLANLFPRLRRSAYKIDFTVPEYSVKTIKEIYKTHPDMLSLYEFYLLANQYEPGSPEYQEVVEKITTVFPGEKFSRISLAMISFFHNNMPSALSALAGMENDPEAWLYFSAVHARMGDLEKAESYARMAASKGDPDAAEHLSAIERYKEDDRLYREQMEEWQKYGIKN